jgi:hypothetical protein
MLLAHPKDWSMMKLERAGFRADVDMPRPGETTATSAVGQHFLRFVALGDSLAVVRSNRAHDTALVQAMAEELGAMRTDLTREQRGAFFDQAPGCGCANRPARVTT